MLAAGKGSSSPSSPCSGLATSYGIVKQHGGHVVVHSAVGRGTTFELYFPRVEGEVAHGAPPDEEPSGHGTETILVVEDEPHVRATTVGTLSHHGFDVLEASDGADALRVLSTAGRNVDLVLTDMVMPALGELGRILRVRHPSLRVLYTSGYPHGSELADRDAGPLPFLAKPYEASTLLRRVRDLLGAGRLEPSLED